MSTLFVFLGLILLVGIASLAFRRRTLWFLFERWKQACLDVASSLSFAFEKRSADAWERVPERVRTQKAGVVVGAFLGSAVLAFAGLVALYGETALAIGTAYAFTGTSNVPNLNMGLALGLASVSAVVFWSMVLTEIAGFTNFSGWIRPDHLEAPASFSEYEDTVRKYRRIGLPALSAGMLVLSIWVLVQLALFREQLLLASANVGSMDEYASFLQSQSAAHGRFWATQAVAMSVSAAFGAVAAKDFLTLALTTFIFGFGTILLSAARIVVEVVGGTVELAFGTLQDLIHLIEPAAEEGLAQPYEDMGFWQEYEPPEDIGEDLELEGFGPDADPLFNRDVRIVT